MMMKDKMKRIICFALVLTFLVTVCCACGKRPVPVHSDDLHSLSGSSYEEEEPWCAHRNTKKISDKNPTCTEEGYEDRLKCKDCGAILENTGRILTACGHRYEDRQCIYCEKNEPTLILEGVFEGSAVKWQLFDDGELSVSGKGRIPDMPENENSYFFRYNKFVKSIVIYNGITEIGNNVFRNLKDVVEISIASSVYKIGDRSFDGWSLKTLNLSSHLKSIGKNNFTENQLFFLELPWGLEHVGAGSFTSAQMITLRIPSSVKEYEVSLEGQYTNIPNIAFMGTQTQFDRLDLARYLRVDGECSMVRVHYQYTAAASELPYCTKRGQTSGDFTYAVYTDNTARITAYRGSSSEIEIPKKVGNYTVVAIDHNCFEENTNVKKITLPESCTAIYAEAFLESGLEELVIKSSVMRLAPSAFEDSRKFATLVFEGTFLDIGARAFANTKVENITLDKSMNVVRTSALAHSSIKNVNFSQFEIISDSAFGYTSLGSSINLQGVKEIGRGAFYRAGLKSVDVTGVKSIGTGAFSSNSGLSASSVTGYETVTKIEEGAFDFKFKE